MSTTTARLTLGTLLVPSVCFAASMSMLGCKSGVPAAPPPIALASSPSVERPGAASTAAASAPKPVPPPEDSMTPDDKNAMHIDAEKRRRVLDGIARALRAHYVFPDVAEKMIRAVDDAVARGAYDGVDSAGAFAQAVAELLHDVSGDGHLRLLFGPPPPP